MNLPDVNPHGLEADVDGLRPAADAHEKLVALDLGAVVQREHDRPVGALAPHRGRVHARVHDDPLVGERRAHLVAGERLLAREQAGPALDDDDLLATEPLEALGHLGADRAAAEHEQPARQLLGRGDASVVPRVHVREAGDRAG